MDNPSEASPQGPGIGDNSATLNRLAGLVCEINAGYDRIQKTARKNAEEMVAQGKRLLEAHELVKHGEFKKWIADNIHVPYSTAVSGS